MRRRLVSVSGSVACLALLPFTASQATQQQPAFRAGVEAVRLDVSVLDRDRRPVSGLTIPDFEVLQDGRLQKVVALSEIELAFAAATSAPWASFVTPDVVSNQLEERRLFVMVLDDATVVSDPAALREVKRIANRLIDRLGPMDLMAVVFTADNRRPQNFTQDKPRLRAAVERFTRLGGLSSALAMEMSVETLAQATEVLIDVPDRRKALLYVGTGVAVDLGLAATPAMASLNSSMYMREIHTRLSERMSAVFAAAERSNVNVYTFDAAGLRGRPAGNLPVEFMQALAGNTGGRAFINANDTALGVDQMFRENGSYYLIAYESDSPIRPGEWRRIEVRTRRAGLEVRSRTRHYASESPDPAKRASRSASTALAGLLPDRGIPLTVTLAPIAPAESAGLITVSSVLAVGHYPADAATIAAARDLEVQVSAFDPEGRPRGTRRYDVRLPVGGDSYGRIAELVSTIDVRPGPHEIRFAVRDKLSNHSGSVYADVEVPDFSRATVSLSGVLLSSTPAPRSAPRDALAPLAPIQPTASRQFKVTDELTAFARIYRGGRSRDVPSLVTVRIEIVDESERSVFSTTEAVEPARFRDGGAAVRVALPLRGLDPGSYLLKVVGEVGVKDRDHRSVLFEIK